jgi:hypothetical protein
MHLAQVTNLLTKRKDGFNIHAWITQIVEDSESLSHCLVLPYS